MANIANLSISITARIGKFQSGLAKARKSVDRFSNRSLRIIQSFSKGFGLAIAGASLSLAAIVKNQFKVIDSTTKMADRLGIGVQKLLGLQHAAQLTGNSTSNLQLGLQRMTRRVSEAAQGAGEAKGALRELGLDAQKLASLSPDQQFSAIADAMEQVNGQSNRVRLAFKLFDSEGVGLLNTLKGGSKQLQAYQQEALKLSGNLSRIDATKIEIVNNSFQRLRAFISGLARSISVKLALPIADLIDRFIKAATEGNNFGKSISKSFSLVGKGAGLVVDIVNLLRGSFFGFKGIVELVAATAIETFNIIGKAITRVINLIPGVNIEFTKFGDELVLGFSKAAEGSFGQAGKFFDDFANGKGVNIATGFFDDLLKKSEALGANIKKLPAVNIDSDKLISNDNSQIRKMIALREELQNRLQGSFGEKISRSKGEFRQIDLSRISVGQSVSVSKNNKQNVHDEKLASVLVDRLDKLIRVSNGAAVAG